MNKELNAAVDSKDGKPAKANLAEELQAAIIGIPMTHERMEAAASTAIPLLSLLGTLYDIDVEGIEPITQPMFRTSMTSALQTRHHDEAASQ